MLNSFRKKYPTLGTLGGHLIFLNLGEQIRTSETGDELGTFTSYMTAMSLSYSALISPTQSFGINSKMTHDVMVSLAQIRKLLKPYTGQKNPISINSLGGPCQRLLEYLCLVFFGVVSGCFFFVFCWF